MSKAEEAALKAYPDDKFVDYTYADMCRGFFKEGYEQSQQDIIALIKSCIDEILGDTQPNPILRMELNELIKKIES